MQKINFLVFLLEEVLVGLVLTSSWRKQVTINCTLHHSVDALPVVRNVRGLFPFSLKKDDFEDFIDSKLKITHLIFSGTRLT